MSKSQTTDHTFDFLGRCTRCGKSRITLVDDVSLPCVPFDEKSQTTGPWDRECVVCATKWLEADDGTDCPECEYRKAVAREGRLVWKDGKYGRAF